jgi:hypothetical protein
MLQATSWQKINIKFNPVILRIYPLHLFVCHIRLLKDYSHALSFTLKSLCFRLVKYNIFTTQTFFVVTLLT